MIYLIEDSVIDAEAITRAFNKTDLKDEIVHFETGDAALANLDAKLSSSEANQIQLPRLIILDLNLPGLDGNEVLKRLKTSVELKAIPVLVLSSTSLSADVQKVYSNGANAFIRKPVGFETLSEMILYTQQFWFSVAVMPKNFH